MDRLSTVVTAFAVLAIGSSHGTVSAQAPVTAPRVAAHAGSALGAIDDHGSIEGLVLDDRGQPLAGAVVSAMGETMTAVETDGDGRFRFGDLEPSEYVVRAHRLGFAASARVVIEVTPGQPVESSLVLRRLSSQLAGLVATGRDFLVPHVLAAEAPSSQPEKADDESDESPVAEPMSADDHSHEELAWRLRRLKRTVLRETTTANLGSVVGSRPLADASTGAATLFADLPISTEFNFLTVSAFDAPGDLLSGGLPKGVTYVTIGAPTGLDGRWAVRGALTQGDLSGWYVGGSYANEFGDAHQVDVAMSYAMQRYTGGNPAALAALADGSRNVGALSASDRWALASRTTVSYGANYARYDYLERPHLVSPNVGVEHMLGRRTTIHGSLSQQMTAPGAQEFLPPMEGIWLPPERTFSSLVAGAPLRPERTRHAEVGIAYGLAHGYSIGARRFHQSVDDQVATVFDARVDGEAVPNLGHYYVASPGGAIVDGWAVGLTAEISKRLRGSVDYAVAHGAWSVSPAVATIARSAVSAVRLGDERFHDLTTTIEAEIPETSTRVFVFYRINSAYARESAESASTGVDARFDIRLHQGLPFMAFTNVDWEFLLAVRNLFHDPGADASLYDEMLTVRPPKRIVGGLMVRF